MTGIMRCIMHYSCLGETCREQQGRARQKHNGDRRQRADLSSDLGLGLCLSLSLSCHNFYSVSRHPRRIV